MQEIYNRVKGWYFNLPWYWKIAGGVIILLVGILYVLAQLRGVTSPNIPQEIDVHQATKTNEELKSLEAQEAEITRRIDVTKKEIATKINQSGFIDQAALDRREEINQATSMEELDAIQKRHGL